MSPDGGVVVMLPGPPGHLRALMDEVIVPELLDGRGEPVTVTEVEHDYPETLLVGELRRIRARYATLKAGSYPGEPMSVRFSGEAVAAESAAADLRAALAGLDSDPTADLVRAAWRKTAWGES